MSQLCPDTAFYGQAYERAGLFGGACPTVMAHCVWSGEAERALMKENGVFIAHCPQSNMNVSSGIAPIKRYLLEGQKVGLGSDVAGGAHLSLFRAMTDAIQCSSCAGAWWTSRRWHSPCRRLSIWPPRGAAPSSAR